MSDRDLAGSYLAALDAMVPAGSSVPEQSFGGGAGPAVLIVTCPECGGDGAHTYRGLTGPEMHERCGTCPRGSGQIEVTCEDDARRLFISGDGERYVATEHPPFSINGDLYVLDGAGDTVLVEPEDADCSTCGAALVEGTTEPLCPRCARTHRAHGRLGAERTRQERAAVA